MLSVNEYQMVEDVFQRVNTIAHELGMRCDESGRERVHSRVVNVFLIKYTLDACCGKK